MNALCSRGARINPKRNTRRKSTRWRPILGAEGIDYPEDWAVGLNVYRPTPETSPDAISESQRADVRHEWVHRRLRSVEAISEAVILPVGIVRRRLSELGIREEVAA